VKMCADRQLDILLEAAQMLRPGGRLVYSTCTFAPEENEGVIAAFLAKRPDYEIETVDNSHFAPGHPEWVGGPEALSNTFRLWPHLLKGEGHFAAVLRRAGDESLSELPALKQAPMPKEFLEFAKENLPALPDGFPLLFGQTLYLVAPGTPELQGLRVMRAGLELGQLRKGRFEPAHALALWLKEAKNMVSYAADSEEISRYLHGETLATEQKGWILVQVDGYSLGWGKGAAGILKNHYPKGLRKV